MRRSLFAFAFCLLAALHLAPAVAAGPAITIATPAMWTVHGPKGTAYLLGSVHALPKNVVWQAPYITAAMARADAFVFEIPMDKATLARGKNYVAQNAVGPRDISLADFFDDGMRIDYHGAILTAHADPTAVVYMQILLAAVALQSVADSDSEFVPAEGVDNKVYAEATARGITQFRALETPEAQMPLFMSDGSLTDRIEKLRLALKESLEEHGESMQGALAAWAKGDAETLARLGPDGTLMSPQEKKLVFENRNKIWVPEIEAMLAEPHTYFITVGAGHLVGKTGVPNLLRAAGYKVDGP